MLLRKRSRRILALGLSCALLLTSLAGGLWSAAAIELDAAGTATNADIIFEPSTVTTGSLGWKEYGKLEELIAPTDYGVGENGLYALATAAGNQGWLNMYDYDEESQSLKLDRIVGNFTTAYKVAIDASVTAINRFSGRLYSSKFESDQPNAAIVLNYIDNGNYDMVYPYITGGNLYFRTWSVRTETLTQGGLSYKKIYGSKDRLDQDGPYAFAVQSENVGGETLNYIDFSVEYTAEGAALTLSSGAAKASKPYANDFFLTKQIDDILDGAANRRDVSSFGSYPLSEAKAVGFAATHGDLIGYADNVTVDYTYTKSTEQLAQEFKAAHGEILAKESAQASDTALIQAALEDYQALLAIDPGIAEALAAEKAKLDGFMADISGNLADAWFASHAAAIALTADTVSKDNLFLVKAAQTAYNGLDALVRAEIVQRFNAEHGTSYADLNEFFDPLADAVYYDGSGMLVYDDFSGANADAWEQITVGDRTFTAPKPAVKPDARLMSVTWDYTIVPKNLAGGANPIVLYADGENYIMPRFAYEPSWDETFWNAGSATPGVYQKWYYGSHSRSGVIGANEMLHVSFTISYDYTDFDGEPSQIHPNFAYAAKHIDVTMESYYHELNYTSTQDMVAIILGDDSAPAVPQDLFRIGYYDTNDNIKLESVEFTYAKAAGVTSEEFEAYADTYGLDVSEVTKDNAEDIDAALAVYETLNAAQKEAYKAEQNHLLALKSVADFHAAVAAYAVTPASEAQIAAYRAQWMSMQAANTTVEAAVTALDTALDAFRPTMYSATIKVTEVPEEQDLRFKSTMSTNTYSENIVRYGTVMLPNQLLADGVELTLDTKVDGYTLVDAAYTVEEGDTLPAVFYGNLGGSAYTKDRCGIRIAARAYIVYEMDGEEYILYSTNSNAEGSREDAVGVENGYCVRSVNLIARRMAKVVIETAGQYGEVTYTEHITASTASGDIDAIEASYILEFTSKNKAVIERYSQSQQQ